MFRSFLISFFLFFSCSKESTDSISDSCSTTEIETALDSSLESYNSDADFTFYIERDDGRSYTFSKGSSSLSTVYESASTSKLVTSAIILWTVENTSALNLTDKISDHYSWSMPSTDSLYEATLSQLLSFTSGLEQEANCIKLGFPSKTYDECINDTTGSIVSVNKASGVIPNTSFYYSSSHMQLAGAMAYSSSSYSDWQSLFTNFKQSTGLFGNSTYSLPSTSNARLAGGMTWTASDYIAFLRELYKGNIFSESMRSNMFTDHVGNKTISYSPAFDGLGEQWHYGYGIWLECESSSYNCSSIDYYSSPGAYGAYPFLNIEKKFFGLVARQGSLGTFSNGIKLYRSVRNSVESWASCSN